MNTSNKIFSNNSLSKTGRKLNYLDLRVESSTFNGLRLSTSIILFGILIFLNYGFIFAPLFTTIYFLLFEYILLDLNIIRRKKRIEHDAIEFFRIFLLNNNRNIKKSLQYTSELLENNIISKEFNKTLKDVQLGKSFDESLTMMINRIPSDFVVNILYSIIESNRAGNSLNNSISNQIEYLEKKENNALINRNKTIPIKMLIICIITITILIAILVLYKRFI